MNNIPESFFLFDRAKIFTITDEIYESFSLRPRITDEGWQLQAVGQFAGLGASDLLWQNIKTGQLILWQDRVSQTVQLPSVTAKNWEIRGSGLFNGDDNSALLWYNRETQDVAVWYMDGAGGVAAREMLAVPAQVKIELVDSELEGSGDFDGDGSTDLLWIGDEGWVAITSVTNGIVGSPVRLDAPSLLANQKDIEQRTEALRLWEEQNSGTQALTFFVNEVWGMSDYNGDGRDDLFVGSGGPLNIWLMNGTAAPEVLGINSDSSPFTEIPETPTPL